MITLFHFSDFHSGPDSNIYDKNSIDASKVIVDEINRNHLKVDYIIFTGDLAYKENGFSGALTFFNELSEKLKLDKDKFLFVPGNHEMASGSKDKGFDFTKYRTFVEDFYEDKIKYIYTDNYRDKFKKSDFSFDYLIDDKILISGFHRKSYDEKKIDINFFDDKMEEHAERYGKNKNLIKIALIHEAVLPLLRINNADLLENAGYFTKKLAEKGYRIILTGHSHKSGINLLNNEYLNISVGSFGFIGSPKRYNVIRIDLNHNRVTVKAFAAEEDFAEDFLLKQERLFEVREPGIFELTNLNVYPIPLKPLLELANKKRIGDEVIYFLQKRGVNPIIFTQITDSSRINLGYNVLYDLSEMLKEEFEDLVFELNETEKPAERKEIPVEIKEIYRGKGENEIRMECIRRNIIEDETIKKYVNIYIDEVEFNQKDQTGAVNNKPGKYICIEPATTRHGAVVLPVDKDGNVLLVNQFRHPQRKFITEAIRGFSDFEDDSELITALREFSEEGGGPSLKDLENIGLEDLLPKLIEENRYIHIENDRCAIKDIFYLRNLYTDTGKLWEAPHYYLFHINHKLQNNNIIRKEPIMESPIWVKFKYILRSIVQDKPIQLENNEIEDVFRQDEYSVSKRKYLFKYRDTLIEKNQIYIEDAFTSQIVFLSLPRLDKFINPQMVKDIFQELDYRP